MRPVTFLRYLTPPIFNSAARRLLRHRMSRAANLKKEPIMKRPITTPKHSIIGLFLLRPFRLVAILIGFAFSGTEPAARATLPPPVPDGGYPGDNTAEGDYALTALTTGTFNVAIGFNALTNNGTGGENTACGAGALNNNTSGDLNSAFGGFALAANTIGYKNTGSGVHALYYNQTGYNNTATGVYSLQGNKTGYSNTATGAYSLQGNTGGWYNTANGDSALYTNQTGDWNTAVGALALYTNTGNSNTACGAETLQNNTSGNNNVASGALALFTNSTGYSNTADGAFALYNNTGGHDNTAVGLQALTNSTGNSNIAVGSNAGSNVTTGSNNIDIGNKGVAGDARKIRIGAAGTHTGTYIAGVYNVNEGGTIKPVYINSNGQLGTQPPASSRRFKTEIAPMGKTSEAILDLEPVTFRYKSDEENTAQFGLIAEEVAKVDPTLVLRDDNCEIYTVRYDAVNAMLLNEFLKEHRKVQEQETTIAELKSAIAEQKATNAYQQKQINALNAGLQKVNDGLKSSARVSQVASSVR
jgi:uncharacterized coiled-coil protein SlyX